MGIFNIIIILQKFQMQCGIPNHYPKFSKLHQFAYIIEPHHQKKVRCDQIQLKNIWGISLTLLFTRHYVFWKCYDESNFRS